MRKTFRRAKAAEAIDLDITSLLDILVILLVFLLLNYNASDLQLDLARKTNVADSESRKITHLAPVIQLNSESGLFLNNKEVGNLNSNESQSLQNLTSKLQETKAGLSAKDKDAQEGILVNFVFDRDTNYEQIQKIMDTTARTGFTQFKFIVKGDY